MRGGEPHAIPDLLKQPVARSLDNRQVKGEIGFDRAAVITLAGGSPHGRKKTFELLQRRRIDPLRGMACGKALENGADRVELHQLLDGNLTDDCAAKRRAQDETERSIAQRLTERAWLTPTAERAHLDTLPGQQA